MGAISSHNRPGSKLPASRAHSSNYLWWYWALLAMIALSACGGPSNGTHASSTIQVVAAENFYGDIARQIGGTYVQVRNILADPNVDPHEYEPNVGDAIAIGNANLVIENGAGYDAWVDNLLSASPDEDRLLIKAYDLAPRRLPDNEHVWYGIDNAQALAQQITDQLSSLDTAHTAAFEHNFQTFKAALDTVRQQMSDLKTAYQGTAVALTETVFLYQSEAIGLSVLTPETFQKAIAEENDPPAAAIAQAEDQITNKQVKVLIYNKQTTNAITSKLQQAADAAHIPTVPITEMMPVRKQYQDWMLDQLRDLESKLRLSNQ